MNVAEIKNLPKDAVIDEFVFTLVRLVWWGPGESGKQNTQIAVARDDAGDEINMTLKGRPQLRDEHLNRRYVVRSVPSEKGTWGVKRDFYEKKQEVQVLVFKQALFMEAEQAQQVPDPKPVGTILAERPQPPKPTLDDLARIMEGCAVRLHRTLDGKFGIEDIRAMAISVFIQATNKGVYLRSDDQSEPPTDENGDSTYEPTLSEWVKEQIGDEPAESDIQIIREELSNINRQYKSVNDLQEKQVHQFKCAVRARLATKDTDENKDDDEAPLPF